MEFDQINPKIWHFYSTQKELCMLRAQSPNIVSLDKDENQGEWRKQTGAGNQEHKPWMKTSAKHALATEKTPRLIRWWPNHGSRT